MASQPRLEEGGSQGPSRDAQDFDPADLIVKKPPTGLAGLFAPLYKKCILPIVTKLQKKQLLNEKRMLRKEEQMKQDVERILMEVEEQHSWVSLGELRHRNLVRLKKEEIIDAAKRKELRRKETEHAATNIEQGLSFKLGNIDKFTRWQNSSSKYQDIPGHKDTVFSVKLSKCMKYVISTSGDNTACLWCVEAGKTRYPKLTYEGHEKKVLDAEFHPSFVMESPDPCIVTCSGDGTLKYWNTIRERAVRTVKAHEEAIYRCKFSPDGTRVLSCSEDKTLKMWTFPEGYCLHVYRGHQSGVTSCSFSPTGRWIVSGSDYGERKLMLWDANMPLFDKPLQYPHQIFWTPDGLVKKLLIRQRKPTPYFWFTGDQIQLLGEKAKVESWTGQYDEIEMPDESDGEADENEDDQIMVDEFGKTDVREFAGATLQVFYTDREGKTIPATEYMPGGKLTFCIECSDVQIQEAFLSVTALDTAYESFVPESGKRLGTFIVTYPLPWEMETAKIDVLGIRKPERIGDDMPEGLIEVDEGQGINYHNKEPILDDDGNIIKDFYSKFGVVWFCPAPQLGSARVQLSFRFMKSAVWNTLTYSLKESPIRVASLLTAKAGEEPETEYTFDQEARHIAFFNHIRDKNWDAVQSFIDKKAVMFKDKVLKKRRWRIMDALEDIFLDAEAMVLPAPVIFKAGQTRSTLLMEYQPYFYKKRPKVYDSDDSDLGADDDKDDDAQEEPPAEDDEPVAVANADALAEAMGEEKEKFAVKGAEPEKKSMDAEEDEEEEDEEKDEEEGEGEEEDEKGGASSRKSPKIPELNLPAPAPGADVSSKYKVKDGDKDEDSEDDIPLSPVCEAPSDEEKHAGAVELATRSATDSTKKVAAPDASAPELSSIHPEGTLEPQDAAPAGETARGVAVREALPLSPLPRDKKALDGTASPEDVTLIDSGLETAAFINDGADDSSLGSMDSSNFSIEKVESIGPDDDEDLMLTRPKTKKQHIKEFIFAGEIEGQHFAHEVEHKTNEEMHSITFMRLTGVAKWREIMNYAADPIMQEELITVPKCPRWVKKVEFKRLPDHHAAGRGEGYYDLLKHPYVKSTLYGPDILKFSMPLPDMYPRKAGRSVNAFTMQLLQFEAARRKEDSNKIALTAAEADKGVDGGEFSGDKSAAQQKRDMQDIIRQQVALHLLSKRSYLATRRNCLPALPGMQEHYPNPNYLEPCDDYPFMPLKKESGGWMSALKVTNFQETKVVSPVGRRKEYPEYYTDVAGFLRAKADAAREATRKMFAHLKRNSEEFSGGDGDNPHFKDEAEAEEEAKAKEEKAAKEAEAKKKEEGEKNAAKEGPEEDTWDEHGVLIPKRRKKKRKKKHEEVEEVKEEVVAEEVVLEDSEAIAAAERERKEQAEKERRISLGIPLDVFLGRRGSFMQAPGLEPFEDGAKAKPQHFHAPDPKDKKGKGSHGVSEDSSLNLNKTHGLIRTCINFLGSEIIHHGSINDVAFAPSESRMATAGGDKLVKLWDPRDGTLVRVMHGHTAEVTSVRYSHDELYLVTADSDAVIIIWDLTTNLVFKRLYGHADAITSLDMSPDCTMLVTSSYDKLIKTWFLTPRVPGQPDPPRVIARTDKTVILAWSAPPAFNLNIIAFHVQWRVNSRNHWEPIEGQEEPFTIVPTARSKTIKNLIAGTPYQFRIRAQNLMGLGPYSAPSKLIRTDLGIPDKVEMPKVCGVTIDTMQIYFFTPNPEAFGGASTRFEVRYSGNGIEMDNSPIKPFALDDGVIAGIKVLNYFKNKLAVKKIKIVQRKEKLLMEKEEDMGFEIAKEFMQEIVTKVEEDPTYLFASVLIENLEPGFEYRFQVRGVNDEDVGPWSDGTYSYATHPTLPRVPIPPFIEERTLTSIKFAWHAPDGRGTAIVGYIVQIQHTGKEFLLPRSQQWFELDHLLPGNSYYIRVKSLNSVGPSEYSDWNSLENSHTLTAKAEIASRPVAVSGTWSEINVESRMPYNNGSLISEVIVQKRWVEAFNKGEWEHPLHMSVQEDSCDPRVTVVEYVHPDAFVKLLLEEERLEAEERKKGFNPFKAKKVKLSLSEKLNAAKPEGSKLSFRIGELQSDKLYEFRVSYRNYMGDSKMSDASHRAKTNAALPPDKPSEFMLTDTILEERVSNVKSANRKQEEKSEYFGIATFKASFDRQGGAHVFQYVIQCRNITVDGIELEKGVDRANSAAIHHVTYQRSPAGAPMVGLYFKVADLICGHVYQFRIRADNEGLGKGIPEGIYSDFTDEVTMPAVPVVEEEQDQQSLATRVSEVYIEEEEEEEDSDIDLDILDQQLPTARGGDRKNATLLKSKGKKGEVEIQKPKGMSRRPVAHSSLGLEPGSF